MKPIRQTVRDYLALRRSLGFKLKEHEPRLWKFVSFLEKKGSARITIPLALEFATQPQHQQPAQWATRLRVVRGFARYRSGEDPRTEIPPLHLLPYRARRARPYLYSAKEIRELLRAAQNLRSRCSLNALPADACFGCSGPLAPYRKPTTQERSGTAARRCRYSLMSTLFLN